MPAPAPQPMFAKDEKVLCFHQELLYEAKVQDVRTTTDTADKKGAHQYFVHYKGWKKTWDDWVPEGRVRKLTDENRELATNLRKDMESLQRRHAKAPQPSQKRRSDRASEDRASSLAAGSRGQKRGRDSEIDREDGMSSRPMVRLPIPDRLKSLLVDDWENVTKNLQLVHLPHSVPVGVLLDEYAAYQKTNRRVGSAAWDVLEETVAGLKEWFEKCLGRILLYRYERQQYYELYKQMDSPTGDLAGKTSVDVYGGEHLLRLFSVMPELVAETNMDVQSVNRLREELSLLASWLSKEQNVRRYFTAEYETPDNAYKEKQANGA